MTTKASGTPVTALELSTESGSWTPVGIGSRRFRALALKQNNNSISMLDFYSKNWHYQEPIYRTSDAPGGTVAGPVNNYYRRELIKVIYTDDEWTNSGWGSGNDGDDIYELTLNVTNVPTYSPYPNYRIYMQNTTSAADVDITTGWTLVYTSASQSFTLGENSFILDTHFRRSPGYGLAICWAWDQCPTNWSVSGTVTVDTVSGKYWRFSLTDAAGSWNPTDAASSLVTTNRPSPRFRRAPLNWDPLAGNTASTHSTTSPGPVNNWFRRELIKSTYTSSEMKTALLWPSYASKNSTIRIARMSFVVQGTPTYQPYPNYKIYMINTASAPGTDITAGWTSVYTNSSQSFGSTGEYFFNVNFDWSTGSNLGICWAWAQCPTTYSATGTVTVYNTPTNNVTNYNWTDAAGEWFATDAAGQTIAYRPKVTFWSNSKIICTKLNELGLLPDNVFNVDQEFGIMLQKNDPDAHAGYLAWAVLVVDWMCGEGIKMMPWMSDEEFKAAMSNWATKWAYDLASPWALEMCRLQGERTDSPWAGKFMMALGIPLSRFIGHWKKRFPRKTDPGFGTGLAMIGVFSLLKVAVGAINVAESLFKRITSGKSN